MSLHRNCESVTRRDGIKLGLGALIGGGLIDALRLRGLAAPAAGAARKTSCILIWMDGGPSHYETFDPKPNAPKEIRGDFKPIATKVPGIRFAEPMTKLAAIADKHGLRWGVGVLAPWFIIGGLVAYTAHKFVEGDVQRAMMKSAEEAEAARAEFEARQNPAE